jgi:hypothetical protein
MADNRLTIFQRLNKALGNEVDGPKYVIDPSSFNGLSGDDLEQKLIMNFIKKLFIMNQQELHHITIMRPWNIQLLGILK